MSQFTFGNINEATTDGFALAAMLENFEAAVNTAHAGNTAPTYKVAGITWRDTSATPHLIKQYDGAQWLTIGSLNVTTHEYAVYHKGTVLTGIATANVGDGLEINTNNLRIKLDGSTLIRSSNGLKVDSSLFATAAQGTKADTAVQPADLAGLLTPAAVGFVTVSGTTPTLVDLKGIPLTVSRLSTGIYRLSFTTARPNTQYYVMCNAAQGEPAGNRRVISMGEDPLGTKSTSVCDLICELITSGPSSAPGDPIRFIFQIFTY